MGASTLVVLLLRSPLYNIIAIIKMAGEVQLAMDLRVPNTWGGAREGAGRKKSQGRRPPEHGERPNVSRHHPRHTVLRTLQAIPRLRTPAVYIAIRGAMEKILAKPEFRVVHMTIQHNHLHFIVEAENKAALSHGMRAVAITCARAINKAGGRHGQVFAHRYYAGAITSPRQMRHVLCYVLNNWRRHNEDERSWRAHEALVDPYSSALDFDGWKERSAISAAYARLPVAQPQTWLMNVGWKRYGPISVYEVPAVLPA